MKLVVIVLLASTAIEFLAYIKPFWRFRKFCGATAFVGTLSASALLIQDQPHILGVCCAVLAFYRLFNQFRLISGLVAPKRLRRTALVTSLQLSLIFYGLLIASEYFALKVTSETVFFAISIGILLISILCTWALRLSKKRMTMPGQAAKIGQHNLPSITVAIPARNETTELEECLRALTASTYPKLEIITLDDCSQSRRTPEIIREFAHAGVRFIQGDIPPEPWLAKNYAYERLLKEANGEYVLFCGVDTRFEPQAITRIVESLIDSKKSMLSLVPINHVSYGKILPYLIQPIRYGWEIALPRRWSSRPPVLSTCWVAKKDFLLAKGGFAAVTHAILPERYFAKQALREAEYAFYNADSSVGLHSVKSGHEQQETAIRTRYPILGRSPENVLYISAAELSMVFLPIFAILYGLNHDQMVLVAINALSVILLSAMYATVDKITYDKLKFVSLVAMPFALIYDVLILHVSMCKYEFSEVLWKGRNICLPLLQTYSHLPKTDHNH